MTELKTLKDIEKLYDLGGEILIREGDEFDRSKIVSKAKENRKAFLKQLKAEAVKWVKEFTPEDEGHLNVINFIKHFFNLTEEDLKNEQRNCFR